MKQFLNDICEKMTEFTVKIEQPMKIELQTGSETYSSGRSDDRIFTDSWANVIVDSRVIWKKSSTLETDKDNIDQLCKEIVTEMIMFSIDGMNNFQKTIRQEKPSPIIVP